MNKYLIALAAAVVAAAPAAARTDRDNKVSVDVSDVLEKLELDLASVALPNNVVRIAPPAAAAACNTTTSQLAYQYQQVGNMGCKAKIATSKVKKAAKEQAVAKTAAQ